MHTCAHVCAGTDEPVYEDPRLTLGGVFLSTNVSLKRKDLFFLKLCVFGSVHTSSGAHGDQRREGDLLELQLQVIELTDKGVRNQTGVL